MSGGSLHYVHDDVRDALRRARISDEQRELVEDIADLLKSVEWCASGDHARDRWRADLAEFTQEWGAVDAGGDAWSPNVEDFVNARDVDIEAVDEDGVQVSFRAETTVPWSEFEAVEEVSET